MAELLCSSLLESTLIPRQLPLEFAKTYGSLGIRWSFVWSHSCGSKKQIPQHQVSPKFPCMASPRGSSLVKYSSTESSCSITNMNINNYSYRKEAAVMAFPLSFFCLAKTCISASNGGSASYFSFPVLRVTIMRSI